nr:hypothetical protein [Tanacetum cinerariifolium]
HGLHAAHHVAAARKVAQRADDGQARTHIGFEEKLGVEVAGQLLELAVVDVLTGGGHLIARHHGHAFGQQRGVLVGGGRVGGYVHEDGVAQVFADNELGKLRQR